MFRRSVLVPIMAAGLALATALTLAWPARAAGVDTEAPTVPAPLTVTNLTNTSLTLNWAVSTDNVGVTGYQVTRFYTSSTVIATLPPATTTLDVSGLIAADTYTFSVVAFDAAGNRSPGVGVHLTMPPGDHERPTTPALSVVDITDHSATLLIVASTDNVRLDAYAVWPVQPLATVLPSPAYVYFGLPIPVGSLQPSSTYTFAIRARDAAGNISDQYTVSFSTGPATPTSPPIPACTSSYRIVSSWPGGFQGEVTFTNRSGAPVTGWNLAWTFAAGQRLTQVWQANLAQVGPAARVTNAAWNGTVAPGGSVTVGFLATWTGSNPAPVPFYLNDAPCPNG